MNQYSREIQIRWADLDPNFHVRHSVYYDWGAFCRIEFMDQNGLTTSVLNQMQLGPILFREECTFRREIRLGDPLVMDLKILKARKDFSRWSFQHHIYKNSETIAAILQVDGAWMNISERKLATPPQEIASVFDQMPKAENFEWI